MTTTSYFECRKIIRRVFAAAGFTGEDVPALTEDHVLTDGNWDEPARTATYEDLATQCAEWVRACTDDEDSIQAAEDVATAIALEHEHDEDIETDRRAANEADYAALRAEDAQRRNRP